MRRGVRSFEGLLAVQVQMMQLRLSLLLDCFLSIYVCDSHFFRLFLPLSPPALHVISSA